mmetsp:Transcript_17519/g.25958  ORF Transcript_17519/g.25958 Transcript_17519/m.25958 type:complete len:97 (-) Transcript_17519:123-413(-)|eukprot:CAMPEP_0194038264 /NCGR_PEP_ID=MMETSP0009_2-20130614/10513_1 /TAXON_ID=210454 /ORGANISM="Grammatophora oceanica, Strain CCMP 410" /LENGTH=96 /DNA_ID=CAMNT_0038680709 /DNA_START=103 /DNA_END=393 /DNA_ORIENTATION=-
MFKFIALALLVAQSAAFTVQSSPKVETSLNAYRQSYQYKLSQMEGQETADFVAGSFSPEGASSGEAAPAAATADPALQEFLAQFEEAHQLMQEKSA